MSEAAAEASDTPALRVRADARAIADVLPAPDEARVRDIVALAGGSLPQALATLSAALASVVAARVEPRAHHAILGGCAHAIARGAVLRSASAGRG